MNLTRANSAVQQFLDFDGTPLSGGRLCTFIHGTTTPIATYKDKNGTLNECEVRLNSRGECDIWLDPSQSYKFVLKRADGSVVWTKDDITADAVYELPSRIVDTVEGSGDVDVTAVASGNSTKYVVKLNKSFATNADLEKKIVTVKYNCGVANSTYDEVETAYYNNKNAVRLMTYIGEKKVFVFNAEATEDSYIKFSGVFDNTLYEFKISAISGWSVATYTIKGKDDELASTIASNQETTNENFRTMGTTLSQGLNQLEASKLSAVSHDATLEGDGTQDNPLKVIGGGGSSTIFSVDGEKLLIQNNVRVEQELLIV